MTDQTHFAQEAFSRLETLLKMARDGGADQADALFGESISAEQKVRLGRLEEAERSESRHIGLRLLIGKRQAAVSGNDVSADGLAQLVERGLAMTRAVPEDPYCGLATADQLASEAELAENMGKMETADPTIPQEETLQSQALAVEEAARAVAGVTNSDGASAAWGHSQTALMASNGFKGLRNSTRHSLSGEAIAGEGLSMETDWDYAVKVFAEDLPDPASIGKSAGERAVARLSPRTPPTGKFPIIYDKRLSAGLVRAFAGAINGRGIARKSSFLLDKMGEQIFPSDIQIIDNPLRKRGLGVRAFDAEGLPTRALHLVKDGVLQSWLLDLSTARQLGLESTASASRGAASPPSPSTSNLYLDAGSLSPLDLYKDEPQAFLVTHLMGMGVNGVTGDYSQGAAGFWLEKGEIVHPVNEATIAGNLLDMFQNLVAANDLEFNGSTNAPSLRIDGMTVAAGS